jgi:OOP family OmpA-OmpF porin
MIEDALRWMVPLTISVICGTSSATAVTTSEALRIPAQSYLQWSASSPVQRAVAQLETAHPTVRIAQAGSIVELDPPLVDYYWVSVTRQPGGVLVFDGYAPDQATRQGFAGQPGASVNWLKLARGEPDRYAAHMDFGLSVLEHVAEGRFSLRENVAVVTGVAEAAADYEALRAMREAGAPEGLVLAMFDVKAPFVSEYGWQAAKSPTGEISFAGLLPSPELEKALAERADITGPSEVTYASGEPANFAMMAETAISLLGRLSKGRVEFDGRGWTLTGTPASAADRTELQTDFASRQLAAAGWSMALATAPDAIPDATVPANEQVVAVASAEATTSTTPDPNYAFSITRTPDGSAVLAGQLPSPATLAFVTSTLKSSSTDAVSIAGGAPPTFGASLQTGLRALVLLEEGALDFSQGRWRLSGTATEQAIEEAVLALIGADSAPWDTDIMVAAAQPRLEVVSTEASEPPTSTRAELCEAFLADFSARNAILFQSGAAIISAESGPALDELAVNLAECTEALVHVEGYTDADGDEQLNLALSVARAEAVVAALIERGIAPRRLYALGFGEANPIADNSTADGKRQNRRIVVKLAGSDG